jgi:hydroxyacylglutathione hydrolase
MTPTLKVNIIPVLKDNYTYVLQSPSGETAIIDPGEAAPVITFLKRFELQPDYIFITHHHADHVGGVQELKETYPLKVIGPGAEADKIKLLDEKVDENSIFTFGNERIRIISTPGHTAGHIVYYFPQSGILFSGDTLFSMGCGRLFEGTPHEMFLSLQKLKALPDETLVYCGHEYTVSGARFSHHIEPHNEEIQNQLDLAKELRRKDTPTLPTTIGMEKKTNVFMRAETAAAFAELRRKKDIFS